MSIGKLCNVNFKRAGANAKCDLHPPNSLKFLPEEWDEKAFYIRSTDYNRTQESVQQLVSAGLYPPGTRDESFSLKIRTRYS
jgi:hypothetical protein